MAERRMFAKSIVTSDAFLDLPMSARCLYFTLGTLADDDGFVNNPKSIMRQVGASQDDMNVLIAKKFLIVFDNGVIVIKHWRIHNYIRSDRYKATNYKEEKAQLTFDENGAYTKTVEISTQDTVGIPSDIPAVDKRETQDRLGKDNKYIYSAECERIVTYLNEKTGSSYRHTSKKTRSLVQARMNEGFSVDDFFKVIDKKSAEWQGTSMAKFLRPETLFGTKFEGYLNQVIIKDKPKGNSNVYTPEPPKYKEFEPEPEIEAVQMPDEIRAQLGRIFGE